MKAYKITEKLWRFEENTVGVFSPSKFTINLLNNEVTIIYHNNLKSLVVKVVDFEVYDIGATSPFTTSRGVALMTKLAELNCPCFHKDENNFYGNNFDPANFDLEEFTNTSTNPFIRQDELGNFDEFIEGYFDGTNFYTDALFTNLITPELNKYYVDLAETPSKIYRWSGTTFVAVGGGGFKFSYHKLGRIVTNVFGATNEGKWLSRYTPEVNAFATNTGVTDKALLVPNYASVVYRVPQKCKIINMSDSVSAAADYQFVIFKSSNPTGLDSVEVFYGQSVSNSYSFVNPNIILQEGDWLHFYYKRTSAGQSFYNQNITFQTL